VMGATAPSAIAAGGTATAMVTLTAGSSYSGTLNISCALTKSPANAQSPPTCALNPSTATIAAGGNATTTLTVKTTAATSAMLMRTNDRLWGRGTEAAAFAALLMISLRARRRRWLSVLALLITAICVVSGGCGGSHSTPKSTPGTTAGNYVFTVKAADSKDATIATSASVNVTVQ
jgi:trimeric autotransporter adhesin